MGDEDITSPKRTKSIDEIFCRSCGKTIKKDVEICPHCGVRNIYSGKKPSNKIQNSNYKSLLSILYISGLILLILANLVSNIALMAFSNIVLFIIFLASIVIVYKDTQQRGISDPLKWAFAVFLLWIIVLPLYILKGNQYEVNSILKSIGVLILIIIISAILAAFVFGLGSPETAPQASVKASSTTMGDVNAMKLEHQGGDEITFGSTNTKTTIDGTEVTVVASDTRFEAGEEMYIFEAGGNLYLDSTENTTDTHTDIVSDGSSASAKIVDVPTQQLIMDSNVRF